MKSILLFAATLTLTSSAFASSLMENISCKNANKTLTVSISTVNRPDFDLSKYDSRDKANNDGINLSMNKNGMAVSGDLVTYASINGTSTSLTDVDKNGKQCVYGTLTKGTQVAVKVSIGGQDRLEILTCNDELAGPHGGECDWK
jgi:hypothetical protein